MRRFPFFLLAALLAIAACTPGEADDTDSDEEETADGAPAEVDVLPPDPLPRSDTARAALARPDTSNGRSLAERLDDASLAARVKMALLDHTNLRAFDFDVTARRGQVAVAGSVATAQQQALVAEVARDVDGVRGVANRVAAPDAPAPEPTVAAADTARPTPPPAAKESPPVAEETPPAAAEPPQEAAQHHTVRSGESLWTISRQYNTTVEQLRVLNDLDHGSKLKPGQRLRVK